MIIDGDTRRKIIQRERERERESKQAAMELHVTLCSHSLSNLEVLYFIFSHTRPQYGFFLTKLISGRTKP